MATEDMVAVVALESSNDPLLPGEPSSEDQAIVLYERAPAMDSQYTSVDVGLSPFEDDNASSVPEDRRLILMGESNGDVTGVTWNGSAEGDGMFVEEERMMLSGLVDSVDAVKITDLDESGYADLLVTGDGEAHWFYTASLVNRATFEVAEDLNHAFFVVDGDDATLVTMALNTTAMTLTVGQGPDRGHVPAVRASTAAVAYGRWLGRHRPADGLALRSQRMVRGQHHGRAAGCGRGRHARCDLRAAAGHPVHDPRRRVRRMGGLPLQAHARFGRHDDRAALAHSVGRPTGFVLFPHRRDRRRGAPHAHGR